MGQMKGLHGKFECSADTGEHKSEWLVVIEVEKADG